MTLLVHFTLSNKGVENLVRIPYAVRIEQFKSENRLWPVLVRLKFMQLQRIHI